MNSHYLKQIQSAYQLYSQGRLPQAETAFRRILESSPEQVDALQGLSLIVFQRGHYQSAIQIIKKARMLNPNSPDIHYNLGNMLMQVGQLKAAIECYEATLKLSPTYLKALNNLGNIYSKTNELTKAANCYRQILVHHPNGQTYYNLGNIYQAQGQSLEAINCYQKALNFQPTPSIYNNLGNLYNIQGKLDEAIQCYEQALKLGANDPGMYIHLGIMMSRKGDLNQAIEMYNKALKISPNNVRALINMGTSLAAEFKKSEHNITKAISCYQQAIQADSTSILAFENLGKLYELLGDKEASSDCYKNILKLDPNRQSLKLKMKLQLPPIVESDEFRAKYRLQFSQQLDELLAQNMTISDPIRDGIVPFYFAMHNANYKPQFAALSNFYEQTTPSLLYTAPHCLKKADKTKKRRVGFISMHYKKHSISKLIRGFFANFSNQNFSKTVFMFYQADDESSAFIAQHSDKVIVLEQNLERARQQIAEEELDLLLYWDICMEPYTYFLGFARLAPVQCVYWGYGATTGIKNIDYFIGWKETTEKDQIGYYSEKVILTEQLPSYFYFPPLPDNFQPRSYFGLEEELNLYVCAQSVFKILPDFDTIIRGILTADPKGKIVLLEGAYQNWTTLLLNRLKKQVPELMDRIFFCPRNKIKEDRDFWSLLAIADVALDPSPLSGGITTMETFAIGTPIITLPHTPGLTRLTASCYKTMGMKEYIPKNIEEYIEMAIRVTHDSNFKQKFKDDIRKNRSVLYENIEAVHEFESIISGLLN